jgi:hypothetical protein
MRTLYRKDEPTPDEPEGDSSASDPASEDATTFKEAARLVCHGKGSDRRGSADDVRESEQQQIIELLAAGKFTKVTDEEFESLLLLSNKTSEHEVRRRESDGRVIKRTWAGTFGQIPCLSEGRLGRRTALPSEYLHRQALQIEVFESTISLEGVNVSRKPSMLVGHTSGEPSFVISQVFIEAEKPGSPLPSEKQISDFLHEYGFSSCAGTHFGWFRKSDSLAITDAKPDNFVLSPEGVVPIDLQIAFVDLAL